MSAGRTLCERLKKFRKKLRLMAGMDEIEIPAVRIEGVIGAVGGMRRKGVTAEGLREALDKAFGFDEVKAVVLVINSPGGSPAQSSLIYKYIKRLKAEKNVTVIAFIEDTAASGGYYIASAADEIYADENSIVGSVGVVFAGFGFRDAIEKIGVERRVYTAGKEKVILDPFKDEKPEDVARIRVIQQEIHENFKKVVRASRGSRLKAEEEEVLEGAFFAGATAAEKGLVDGIASPDEKIREKYGEKAKLKIIETDKRGFLERKFGLEDAVSEGVSRTADRLLTEAESGGGFRLR